jgi:acylphosphatase
MSDSPTLEYKGLHILVDGHVQGVGFRYFVYDFAQQHGLTGWVRNRWSGQVEILAEGLQNDLDSLIEHVRRGPGRSMVSDLKYEWRTAEKRYDQFSMLPTE